MDEERTITVSVEHSSDHFNKDVEDYINIFNNLPVAVIEIDFNGVIHKVNYKASNLLNTSQEEILLHNLSNFIHKKDLPFLPELINELKNSFPDEVEPFEIRITPKNCELITTNVAPRILNFDSTDEEGKIIVTIEDISYKKQDQAEFERYFEELQITRDDLEERTHELALLNEKMYQSEMQLEEMNRNKDKFFSLISHDLRSPFNSLLGLTKLIYEDFDDFSRDEIKESIYNLQQVSEGMYSLIEDLLNWSRIQFNNVKFEPREFNLFIEATKLTTAIKSVAKDKNITIVNVIPKELYISADVHMITSILRNLLNNSIKFTPKYGLIKISAKKENEITYISVEDNGVGIKSERIKNLFKIGSKISTPGTEGEAGTGLGLVLCKEFVKQHGGEIWVESEKDHGSKFTFSIPSNIKANQ